MEANDNINNDQNSNIEDNIEKKYKILDKLGTGGYCVVYLVKDYKTNIEFAAKVFDKNTEDDREKKINELVSSINSDNILKFVTSGVGTIVRKGKVLDNKKYYIFDYAPKKDLLRYVMFDGGIKEKYAKVIFKKILKTINEIHKIGIYHLDIKLDNILLDDNFNPKIGDFGLSRQKSETEDGFLNIYLGTVRYRAPQIELGIKYNCIQADIFSLGVVLFMLVTGRIGFGPATSACKLYALIMEKKYKPYWNKLKTMELDKSAFNEEFQNLYLKMVAYEESDRAKNIDEILKDPWFNEIKTKNDDEEMILNEQVRLMFVNEKEEKVNKAVQQDTGDSLLLNSKTIVQELESIGNEKEYFEKGIKIAEEKYGKRMDNFMKFNENLEPISFMNSFIYKIKFYMKNCEIKHSTEKLQFNLIINPKEKSDDDDFDLNLANIPITQKVVIKVKLFKAIKGGYILRFNKREGNRGEYYGCLMKIMKYANKVFK